MPHTISKRPTPGSSTGPLRPGPRFLTLLLGLSVVVLLPAALSAQTQAGAYETGYAVIRYESEKDLFTFTRNIGSGLSFLLESPEKNPLLAKSRVDRIVDMVGGLLGMRPPNLRFTIRLYRTQAELDAGYRGLGLLGAAPPAFYSYASRSIFVSLENITDRMLAHEIAHAIICQYFSAPPPMRMQEVLAQYVDKHLGEEE